MLRPSPRRRFSPPIRAVALAAALAVAGGCAGTVDPVTAVDVPEPARQTVRAAVDQGYRHGVVVLLVNPAGVHRYAVGAEGAGPDEHTSFAVGSLTKVFTGLLLADMVERGELDLDAPVDRYLPAELRLGASADQAITLRHLATHTSGLPKDAPGWDWDSARGDDVVRFVRDLAPRPQVGRYEYSNLGMALLGRVMERRADQSLETLFAERLFGPLGLEQTGFRPAPGAPVAPPHDAPEGVTVASLDAPAAARAAAGLYSTAADLARLVQASLEPASSIPSPLAGALALARESHAPADEDGLESGLGWKLHRRGERVLVHHGGQSAGHQSFVGFDPARGVGVVLLADSKADDGLDRVALHLLAPEVPLPDFSRPRAVELPEETLRAWAGSYQLDDGNSIDLVLADGGLTYVERTPAGKLVRETEFLARSARQFFLADVPVEAEMVDRGAGSADLVLRFRGREFVAHRVDPAGD